MASSHIWLLIDMHALGDRVEYVGLQASAGRSGRRFLDLHGQHVPEALAILEAELSSGSTCGTLQILVGAGRHTKVMGMV